MEIALCLVWPAHVDFPLFRKMLKSNQKYFSAIYCQFTNTNQNETYQNYLEKSLPFVTFVNFPKKDEEKKPDWRNEAVGNILEVAQHNNHITHYLFIEQDFLVKSSKFWEKVVEVPRDFVYYDEGGRIHPAFALVDKKLVQGTTKDFSANPPAYDHFGKFFQEIKEKTKGLNLEELGLKPREDFYHLAGCTQNFYCSDNDQPLYKPDEFLAYNYHSLYLPDQNNGWVKREASIFDKYGSGDKDGFIKEFFI